jgi:hypothetical protein
MPDRPDGADMDSLKMHRPINPGCRNQDNEGSGNRGAPFKKVDLIRKA